MRVVSAVVLMTLVAAGCARKHPDTPQSTPPATPPQALTPAKPAGTSSSTPKDRTSPQTANPPTSSAPPGKPAPSTTAKPAAPASTTKTPTLDLNALKAQLKGTKAIGLMTKLTLKNQVDDLLDRFRDHYAGKGNDTMAQLRQSYDLLMMKVLSLLQDKDQKLASDIVASREVIWGLLADPVKFAALEA
jgi:hypothetical protein